MNRDAQPESVPASWILELRLKLEGEQRLDGDDERILFVVPLFVEDGALQTVLGEDLVGDADALARISFPAGRVAPEESVWSAAAGILEEAIGIPPAQALQLGELPEFRTLGGLRILPLVVAIPNPALSDIELGSRSEGGLALFSLALLAILEPQETETRSVMLPEGVTEVEVVTVLDHQLWGPSLEVLLGLVALLED